MNQTRAAVRDTLDRTHGKQARRTVSRRLVLYHQSLLDALSGDSLSFFERVMQEAEQDIIEHRLQRPTTQPPRN
jgi:hypothetical protein